MTEQAPPPPATPAGWYPEGVNGLRYWDGETWTDHRAPAGTAATAAPKRTRNYLGDVSLALGVIALICALTVTHTLFAWPLLLVIVAGILGIVALATARGTRGRATAIVSVILNGGLVLFTIIALATYSAAR